MAFSLFVGCSEETVKLAPLTYNKSIEMRTDLKNPGDVISNFYKINNSDDNKNIIITEENLGQNMFKATLVNNVLNDDSMLSEKIIMTLFKEGLRWKVLTIEKNLKCHNGRGHTGWGINPCS